MSMLRLIHAIERKEGEAGLTHCFWCPACKCGHGVSVRAPGPVWVISGPDNAPTIVPSVKVEVMADEGRVRVSCCHLNVTSGMLHYHGDCTHGMAGWTIPMEEF